MSSMHGEPDLYKKRKKRRRCDLNQVILQAMALCGVVWYLIFYFIPYYGLTIAFKDFNFKDGILGSPWVGFKYFWELVSDGEIVGIITNTFCISAMKVFICLPVAVLFALLLNELQSNRFKKIVQTVSYFPHFISWIVISLIAIYWFSPEFGMVNSMLMRMGVISEPLMILTDPDAFYGLSVLSEIWKETGWSSILFIAAIAGVDPSLYEAAVVDGATRLQKIRYITLPSIMGTVVLVFLMNFSGIFSGSGSTLEQSMFLGNAINYERSMVLGYYTMKTGISLGRFSYATMVGLINAVVSLSLLLAGNAVCKRLTGYGLYNTGGLK